MVIELKYIYSYEFVLLCYIIRDDFLFSCNRIRVVLDIICYL